MEYYVYVILNPLNPGNYRYGEYSFSFEPFYVGKGKRNRKNDTLKDTRNQLKRNVINKIKANGLEPIRLIVSNKLTEDEAFRLEVKIIEMIGRRDLCLGTLCNFTNGGEGGSGYNQSDETKQKRNESLLKYRPYFKTDEFKETMKASIRIRKADPEYAEYRKNLSEKYKGDGNPMYGKKTSDKQKASVKKAHLDGKINLSEAGRAKIIFTNKKRKGKKNSVKRNDIKTYELISPSGEKYIILGSVDLQRFCKEKQLQFHVLKNNLGVITENIVIGNKIFAKNTIGWRIN